MRSRDRIGLLVGAAAVRCFILWQGSSEWLGERIEISTPVNQWKRVKEGVSLLHNGVSPYEGDMFHEAPLSLLLFNVICGMGDTAAGLFFVLLDFLVAFCLAKVAVIHHHQQVEGQRTQKHSLGNGVEVIMIKENHDFHMFVMACYLFNPFTVITCGGYSTLLLTNLSIIFAVWMKLRGSDLLSALGLALAVNFSLYPVMLFCPLVLMAYLDGRLLGSLKYLLWCSVWGGTILFISYRVTGSWDYLQAVYGIMLTVSDLTPNVGLFWYFFTEAFEHFRVFFLCVFQINAFIYVLPLSVRFSDQPLFLTYILLSLMALFKSYPCVGDLTLPLALLPLWSHTFSYLRYTLVVLTMFLVASVLGPVLWYLWIHAGSANANFFFAMTLVYCLAQVFLISDTIYAFLVYNYDLLHGLPRVDKDGKPIKLKLA